MKRRIKLIQFVIFWDEVLIFCLNFVRYFQYLLNYRAMKPVLDRNRIFRNRHIGERCFIVLSGPSLNSIDIELIADEQVFCVNHFYKTEAFDIVRPNYYCAIDSHFFDSRYLGEKDNYINKILDKTDGRTSCLFSMDFAKNFQLRDNVFLHYGKHTPMRGRIKSDATSMISGFGSVSLFAMNAAIHMGFSEIYLLGYDFPSGGLMPHFYQNSESEDIVRADIQNNKDIYSVSELHWQYYRAQVQHYYINTFANSKNIRIYNCNNNSHVHAFEYKAFKKIDFTKGEI
jgi:hypothetical protein